MMESASTYQAVQAVAPGRLELVRKPIRDPGPGEVRIRGEACGVCHSDAGTVEGEFPIDWLRVLGHEAVGRIDALGAGIQGWVVGQRVNERAHVDLEDADLGDEPAILGATDCPTFTGPGGDFTVATSLVGSRTFPSYLRAMRRADLADDPRFAAAAARRENFAELHRIVQNWILTFADVGALDAQLDEAKIAFGEVRSLKQLSEMEWAEYWDAVQEVSDRNGGSYRLPGRPWHFSDEKLKPLGEPAFQGEHNREVFAELGLGDVEIERYVTSGALVSASLPKAVIENKRQLVSSPVTDILRRVEHET